jgi:hypothetical protein
MNIFLIFKHVDFFWKLFRVFDGFSQFSSFKKIKAKLLSKKKYGTNFHIKKPPIKISINQKTIVKFSINKKEKIKPLHISSKQKKFNKSLNLKSIPRNILSQSKI